MCYFWDLKGYLWELQVQSQKFLWNSAKNIRFSNNICNILLLLILYKNNKSILFEVGIRKQIVSGYNLYQSQASCR